mgnify:CR=1 FL=1|tara:strand:+ start:155 stop:430 length:276 start_codon:yes stop_codon:yes gene_type:complete
MKDFTTKEMKVLSSCLDFCMQDGNVEEDLRDELSSWDEDNNGGDVTEDNPETNIDFDELINLQNKLMFFIKDNSRRNRLLRRNLTERSENG